MSERISKINELIRRQLGTIMTRELELKPGVFITIAKVDTTADLRYTHVFVSIFPESETRYAGVTLKKEIGRLQRMLGKQLRTKPIPQIVFKTDRTEEEADVVEKLMRRSDF